MTSPGLKRPLDYDQTAATTLSNGLTSTTITTSSSSSSSSNNNSAMGGDVMDGGGGFALKTEKSLSPVQTDQHDNGPNPNGTKRRCTDMKFQTSPPAASDVTSRQAKTGETINQIQQQPMQISPPIREHSQQQTPAAATTTTSIDDELNALIQNELYKSQQPYFDINVQHPNEDEKLVLTTRQLRSICEKLVCDRERRLREEYDRRLACKLAEQYDLFAKANYLNTFSEPTRTPPNPTPSPVPTPATNHPSLTSTFAAAFMVQRSAASSLVPSGSTSPNTVPSAAASLPNLSTIAANMTANPGAIPSNHHLAAYNLQQQQQQHHHHHHQAAAAAAALRLAHQQQQRISMSTTNLIPSGPVLLTSNLDEQLATPEALFTLFGVFGDVIRVKILFNKKDNALIQMADTDRAQVAQSFLDKQRIFGKVIRVTRSKHQLVQMPRDGTQSDAGLTKDFTNSALHRFKIKNSRNYLNIYPPSNTLHISNIPLTVEEGDLYKAFKEQCGFEFASFKFFPKKQREEDRKMALLRFDSVEHGIIALIKMHNYQITDEHNLRVSFSKSAL